MLIGLLAVIAYSCMAVMSFTMKCNSIADYAEALKLGEAPVAYARVMFLGPGGSGKSSLLDGLMDQPLRLAESTALADILNITYHWVEAADAAEDAWRLMEEEDDVQELASLCQLVVKDKIEMPQGEAAGANVPVSALFSDQGAQKAALIQNDVVGNVVQKAWNMQQMQQDIQQKQEELEQKQQKLQQEQWKLQQNSLQWRQRKQRKQKQWQQKQRQQKQWQRKQRQRKQLQQKQEQLQQEQKQLEHALSSTGPEVMMRIWDCGGQPVFLDILSAFLTSRTMFLLLFDASQPLNNKCQETWNHEGQTYHGKKYNITFLQLMVQWMRLIHASLVTKNEMGTAANNTTHSEATQSEATTDRRQPITLPLCPRIMIVGTRGDSVSSEKAQKVLKEVESSCNERAFQDLVIDKLIIDNTTAGQGRNEDPDYRRIRKKIHEFTHSLTAPTPLAWVSFRKVVQKAAADSPVLSYEQVTTIAEACGIDKSKVPSVLHFYHQLGVYLHYKNIELLSSTIIAEPRWLIKQLCKLLMPEWYHPRKVNLATLWQWLEGKGVLLEPLYQDL